MNGCHDSYVDVELGILGTVSSMPSETIDSLSGNLTL